MAKSTRSKVKRSFRAKKRETGAFAAADAARLQRLSAKLSNIASQPAPEPKEEDGEDGMSGDSEDAQDVPMNAGETDVSSPGKVSTHGPRNSRREQWRSSKGMESKPTPKGMNRQGGLAARRKAGRSKRRR